ncbi:MAG: S26 family signal peptidase [Halobacteriota archaeon]|uniref:S26 family signal peptidase n=1 Tax=Natronomonas sp. TaxID=2184060 RepID=UPI0039763DE1
MSKGSLTYVGGVLLVVVLGAMLVGQFYGTPVGPAYVETDSMAPTMDAGDGFVAIPAAVAGPVEAGDVVTFDAERLHGGGLTTHRVVGETDEGYLTKGDGNPVTDQDGSEPPVAEGQIKAKALQVNGEVVVIPHLGTAVVGVGGAIESVQMRIAGLLGTSAVVGTQGLGYLIGAVAVIAYAVDVLVFGDNKDRSHSRSRDSGLDPRVIVGTFALLIVVAATAAMIGPAGTEQIGMVSAEFESEQAAVVTQGTSSDLTYEIHNGGLLPTVSYFEAGSDRVEPRQREMYLERGGREAVTVTLHAPPETGYYPQYVTERRYLAILPLGTIRTLYGIHPWLPLVAIDGLLGGSFYLLTMAVLGRGRVRDRRPERGWRPRRALGRLYDGDR